MEEAEAVEFSPSYRILEATDESEDEAGTQRLHNPVMVLADVHSDEEAVNRHNHNTLNHVFLTEKQQRGEYREDNGEQDDQEEGEGYDDDDQLFEYSKHKQGESSTAKAVRAQLMSNERELYENEEEHHSRHGYNLSFSTSPSQQLGPRSNYQTPLSPQAPHAPPTLPKQESTGSMRTTNIRGGQSSQEPPPAPFHSRQEEVPSVSVRLERVARNGGGASYELKQASKNLQQSFEGVGDRQRSSGNRQTIPNDNYEEDFDSSRERTLKVKPQSFISKSSDSLKNKQIYESPLTKQQQQHPSKQQVGNSVGKLFMRSGKVNVRDSVEWQLQEAVQELRWTQKQLEKVESSLRQETLNFEESKRYGQILRSMLAQKLDDASLPGSLKTLLQQASAEAKVSKVDLLSYLLRWSNASKSSPQQEIEMKNLKEILRERERQNSELSTFNASLNHELKNAIYALQQADEDKSRELAEQKLLIQEQNSHEKDQLLDYLTDYKKQIDVLHEETLSLRRQMDENEAVRLGCLQQGEDNRKKETDLGSSQSHVGGSAGGHHRELENSFQERSIVHQRVDKESAQQMFPDESDVATATVLSQNNNYNNNNQRTDIVDDNNDQRQTQEEQIKEVYEELTLAREEFAGLKQQLEDFETERQRLESDIARLEQNVLQKDESIARLSETEGIMKNQIMEYLSRWEESQESQEEMQQEIAQLNNVVEEYSRRLQGKESEEDSLSSRITQMQKIHEEEKAEILEKLHAVEEAQYARHTLVQQLNAQLVQKDQQIKSVTDSHQEQLQRYEQAQVEAEGQYEQLLAENNQLKSDNSQELSGLLNTHHEAQTQLESRRLSVDRLTFENLSLKCLSDCCERFLFGTETKKLVEDFKAILQSQAHYQFTRRERQIKIEQLEAQLLLRHSDERLLMDLQQLKADQSDGEEAEKVVIAQRLALEKVIDAHRNAEADKFHEAQTLKNDLQTARKKLEKSIKDSAMKEATARNVQNAYNDLLKEYGRLLRQESSSNQRAAGRSVGGNSSLSFQIDEGLTPPERPSHSKDNQSEMSN